MILLVFASLLLAATLVKTIRARQAPIKDEAQPLTGLGDQSYYSSLSGNDFYNPSLVFDAAPKGLFRRTVVPVTRPDARMMRHGFDSTGKVVVYTESHIGAAAAKSPHPSPTRWFLKSGDNRYVEFGDRKYYPAFKAKS
jgi:hypothetical protein